MSGSFSDAGAGDTTANSLITGTRNAIYLESVYTHASRCHRLQTEVAAAAAARSGSAGMGTVDDLATDLVQQQLLFIRVCCDAALGILLRGKATWSNPSFRVNPADVEEAKRVLQLADVTLKSQGVQSLQREAAMEGRGALIPLTDAEREEMLMNLRYQRYAEWEAKRRGGDAMRDDAAVSFEAFMMSSEGFAVEDAIQPVFAPRYTLPSVVVKGSRLLMGYWPSILVNMTACTVYHFGGQPRVAAARAEKAWRCIQASVIEDPTCLVMACLHAGGGHRAIAEQVIALLSSYAAVLSHLCRLDEALRFAQMSAALSQQLHGELTMRAAFAAVEQHANSGNDISNIYNPNDSSTFHNASSVTNLGGFATNSVDAAKGQPSAAEAMPKTVNTTCLFDEGTRSFIQSPSMLSCRTPTALLTSITLHNCVCIMRRVREQANLPCIACHPSRRQMLEEECSNERQITFLTMALDLAIAELGVVEVKAASHFVPLSASSGAVSNSASQQPHPTTFVGLLQQKLEELRRGQGPIDALARDSHNDDGVSAATARDLLISKGGTHEGRLGILSTLIGVAARDGTALHTATHSSSPPRSHSPQQRLGSTFSPLTGPHSTFSPTPSPSHNYNPTHDAKGLKPLYRSAGQRQGHSSRTRSSSGVRAEPYRSISRKSLSHRTGSETAKRGPMAGRWNR